MTIEELREGLHPLHLPDPVGLWPIAPGWWWLAAAIAVALLLLATAAWLWHRGRHRRRALRRLRALHHRVPQSDQARARELAALNTVLREHAATLAPTEVVAGRSGLAWLHFLDNTLEPRTFTQGPGHCLLDGPYRAEVAADAVEREALFALARRWVRHARWRAA